MISSPKSPKERKDLPTFRQSDVEKHKTVETGIWATYQNAVYDVTNYFKDHPGGVSRLKMAAGKSVHPFWERYQQHFNDTVLNIAEEYRIGNLDSRDVKDNVKGDTSVSDSYANDPERAPAMLSNSLKPWCGEAPGYLLADEFYTPNELFYVRNHHPVPVVDIDQYKLEISIDGVNSSKTLSFHELQTNFKPLEVSCTLQCAGNRRTSFNRIRMTSLAQYDTYAISCAKWKGARLRDVLKFAEMPDDYEELGIKYVVFEALDTGPEGGVPYSVSIQIEKAMDPIGDCILAYEMNGTKVPLDHGYPVRSIVPGFTGFRSCKWVGKIRASTTESDGVWQHNFYKVTPPRPDIPSFDFTQIPQTYFWPVQSVICSPMDGSSIPTGTTEIKVFGVAWSGIGRGILRVDVTTDNGSLWEQAQLEHLNQPMFRRWAWTKWSIKIGVPKNVKPGDSFEIRCKAVDDAYNSQPDKIEEIWNLRGCFNNSQHRVQITLEH